MAGIGMRFTWTSKNELCFHQSVYLLTFVAGLVTMSPSSPCGKPCSTGTHNEAVKTDLIFCSHQWNYDGFTSANLESHRNSNRNRFEVGTLRPVWNDCKCFVTCNLGEVSSVIRL